eukprot:1216811-Prymnesium_polylepis.1
MGPEPPGLCWPPSAPRAHMAGGSEPARGVASYPSPASGNRPSGSSSPFSTSFPTGASSSSVALTAKPRSRWSSGRML